MSFQFTPHISLTDSSQTADIAAIKAVNLAQDTQLAMTAGSAMKTAVDANTLKTTYPSADATKVGQISISSAQDLDTHGTQIAANVNDINALNGRPQLIALTSINPFNHRTHHFGYQDGYNHTSFYTDNAFFHIDPNFRVNFQPLGAIVNYKIKQFFFEAKKCEQ